MGKKTRPSHIRLSPSEAYLAQQAIDAEIKLLQARPLKYPSTDREITLAALDRLQCRIALFLEAYLK